MGRMKEIIVKNYYIKKQEKGTFNMKIKEDSRSNYLAN